MHVFQKLAIGAIENEWSSFKHVVQAISVYRLFKDLINLIIWCFLIFVQGFELIHVEMAANLFIFLQNWRFNIKTHVKLNFLFCISFRSRIELFLVLQIHPKTHHVAPKKTVNHDTICKANAWGEPVASYRSTDWNRHSAGRTWMS